MRIQFIGTGGAFTRKNFQSNMLLKFDMDTCTTGEGGGITPAPDKILMIDCGRTAPEALNEVGVKWHDIDALYVSHAHADHTAGIEEFAFARMFIPPKSKPKIYGNREMLHDLWTFTLSGGLAPTPTGKRLYLDDYFVPTYVPLGQTFSYGGATLKPIPVPHIMTSYALHIVAPKGKTVFITTDMAFQDVVGGFNKIGVDLQAAYASDVIFHDCETSPFPSGVHAHYNDLKGLPDGLKSKMWLYHYSDGDLLDAKADGFLGFVTKGQEIEL